MKCKTGIKAGGLAQDLKDIEDAQQGMVLYQNGMPYSSLGSALAR